MLLPEKQAQTDMPVAIARSGAARAYCLTHGSLNHLIAHDRKGGMKDALRRFGSPHLPHRGACRALSASRCAPLPGWSPSPPGNTLGKAISFRYTARVTNKHMERFQRLAPDACPIPSGNPLAHFLRAGRAIMRRHRSGAAFPRSFRLPQAARTRSGPGHSPSWTRSASNTAARTPSCAGVRSVRTGIRRESAKHRSVLARHAHDRLRASARTAAGT